MILVTVGASPAGWPALVDVVEDFCRSHGYEGFAQVGNAARTPEAIDWARFLPRERLTALMGEARLVVSHAGPGGLGDVLRNAHRVVVVPQRPRTRADRTRVRHDEWPIARRLAGVHGFAVTTLIDLPDTMAAVLAAPARDFALPTSDVPVLIREHLSQILGAPQVGSAGPSDGGLVPVRLPPSAGTGPPPAARGVPPARPAHARTPELEVRP